MANDEVYARYRGEGAFFPGVPTRDLSKADFDRLQPLQRADVAAGTIYEIAEGKRPRGVPKTNTQVSDEAPASESESN